MEKGGKMKMKELISLKVYPFTLTAGKSLKQRGSSACFLEVCSELAFFPKAVF